MNKGLSIGVLSWRAHETLRKTLSSYVKAALAANAEEFKIFFNEFSEQDRALANEFGMVSCGDERNLGIWGGMDACAKALTGDVILLLQNDCPAISTPEETAKYINEGVELIRSGRADIIRLRHRFNQGEGISYKSFFKYHYVKDLDERSLMYGDVGVPANATTDTLRRLIMRSLRPFAARRRLIAAIHLEKNPEKVLPRYIRRDGNFLIADSAIAQFSEQPLLISKSLYFKLSDWCRAHPRSRRINGAPVMEHALRSSFWMRGGFKIGFCDTGIFTHNRYDDSWRPSHMAFNKEISKERI
jgi:hypothetical protein